MSRRAQRTCATCPLEAAKQRPGADLDRSGNHYEAVKGRGDFTSEILLAEPAHIAIVIAVFYAILFAVCVKAVRLPNASVLYSIGALTYPLCLLHNQVGRVIFAFVSDMPDWWRLVATTMAAFLLAWVCATFIEPRARQAIAALMGKLQSGLKPRTA